MKSESRMTKKDINHIVAETAVGTSTQVLSKRMDIKPRQIQRIKRLNLARIQKHVEKYIINDETISNALEGMQKDVEHSVAISRRSPAMLATEELDWQKHIGVKSRKEALDISNVTSNAKQQSMVQQNIFQDNRQVVLSDTMQKIFGVLEDKIEEDEDEILDI